MKIRAVGKFHNYSKIFANIAKFWLCTKISLHSEISLCSKNSIRCPPRKDKIVHSVFILFYLLLFYLKIFCFLFIILCFSKKNIFLLLLLNYVYKKIVFLLFYFIL